MSPAARSWVFAGLALALAGAGCSRHSTTTIPNAPLSAHVTQVWPPARSSGVLEQEPLWAEVDTPLDPSTVDDHHVFLKLDTQRVPIAVSWQPDQRRIAILPLAPMTHSRTHTVELASTIRTAAGATLDGGYWWQFRITGAGEPIPRWPAPGASDESPVVMLEWQGTEAAAGPVHYQLFAGADSAVVAARATPPVADVTTPDHPAETLWPLGSTVFWAVTAFNSATLDRRDGPVGSFTTLPAGTPTTTARLPMRDWAFVTLDGSLSCNRSVSFTVAPGYHSAMRWEWSGLALNRRLAYARLELGVTDTIGVILVRGTRDTWDPCTMTLGGPPRPELQWDIGKGVGVAAKRVRHDSVKLASLFEAIDRGRPVDGWVFASNKLERVSTTTDPNPSSLDITYYVLSSADAARASGPVGAGPAGPLGHVVGPFRRNPVHVR